MLSIYPVSAILTPLPLIPFTTEEITGCTIEVTKGANNARRNQHHWFFISCFTVWAIPPINTLESSNDIMILIIPFIPSFKISKVNLFPVLTTPSPIVFF